MRARQLLAAMALLAALLAVSAASSAAARLDLDEVDDSEVLESLLAVDDDEDAAAPEDGGGGAEAVRRTQSMVLVLDNENARRAVEDHAELLLLGLRRRLRQARRGAVPQGRHSRRGQRLPHSAPLRQWHRARLHWSLHPNGTILATAAGQLRTFDASDNKIQKFSGHPVAVRSMIFGDNGEYVLSSGVGERYVAIWRLGSGKTQSSSCILSMEHPAIFVDCKCSGINASEGEIHVLAISEVGICYFWSGNSMDDLRNKKPTKIAMSESSLSRTRQDFAIFAAKLQGIDGPNSAHVLLAYGSVVKPSFDKLLVCYSKDINLVVSEDGVLLPTIQPTMPQKGQSAKTKGTITALDRANAEDAILPLPKLHTQEKKRKHDVTKLSGDKLAIDSDLGTTERLTEKRVPVQRNEDDSIYIEDMLREGGAIDQSIERHPDMATKILSDLFGHSGITIDANLPSQKIRRHLRSLKPGDACKLLENLVSAWRSRSGSAELILRWIYCLLVIHGRFFSSEKPNKLISNLEKNDFAVASMSLLVGHADEGMSVQKDAAVGVLCHGCRFSSWIL